MPQSYPAEPALTIEHTVYTARIVTNCGTIVVALDANKAPHTVNSLLFLVRKQFFDNSACDRLTGGPAGTHILQCGGSTGGGAGNPGYAFRDENLAHAKYPIGTVAMANQGPDTNGSQFFIVYGPSQFLDQVPNYTPFGHVTSGLEIIRRIATAGSVPPVDGQPVQPIVIESINITKG